MFEVEVAGFDGTGDSILHIRNGGFIFFDEVSDLLHVLVHENSEFDSV